MSLDGVIMDSITCKEKRKYHLKFQGKGSAQMQEHAFSREGVCTDAGTCVSHARLSRKMIFFSGHEIRRIAIEKEYVTITLSCITCVH